MCNNKQKINPTIDSELKELEIENKTVLYIKVPESLEVCKTKERIYYRNFEGDFDITDNMRLVVNIFNQKHKIYEEDRIFSEIDRTKCKI